MADTSYQYVSESPDIAAAKKALMEEANLLPSPQLANYQVAGMQPEQQAAMDLGLQGIGAYQPYLANAAASATQGAGNLGEATDILRGADTRNQFSAGQAALNAAGTAAGNIGQYANQAGAGLGNISAGIGAINTAQNLAAQSVNQPGFGQAAGSLDYASKVAQQAGPSNFAASGTLLGSGLNRNEAAVQQAQQAANQSGFNQGIMSLQQGAQQAQQAAKLGAAPTATAQQAGPAQQVTTQSFAQPGSADAYMSPYMQSVVDIQKREAARQSGIQGTQQQAQAAQAGAFGGGRDAIMRAERERNLGQQMGDIQAQGSQAAYQQAQQQFNAEQQARLAAQQSNQQAGVQTNLANLNAGQQTELANQAMKGQYGLAQGQMGLNAANLQQNVGQAQLAAAGQQGQLGLAAAQQQFQAAGYDANTAMQMAQLQQTQQQQALQQSQAMQGIGSLQGQLAGQQGGMQQNAANIIGNLGNQQAGLAGLNASIAGQQAGILGQQSQAQQALGQGIGNLAAQQFGIGSQMAQGIGSLGTQLGNIGTQQAALGQGAQAMGQADVSQLYNMGALQQKQDQAVLDANRVNANQIALQDQQKLAFKSDIYKGAPSSQMAMTQQTQAAPSPFQQIAGLGTGLVSGAAAGAKAGLF